MKFMNCNYLILVVDSIIGCEAQHKKHVIFRQSLVRNCPHAATMTHSDVSRINKEPLFGPMKILQFLQSSIVTLFTY